MNNKLLQLLLALSISGCATEPPKPAYEVKADHQFKVSVYSDGKEVKDFNAPLVHRVDVKPAVLTAISGAGSQLKLPFEGASERDRTGNITGVRVLRTKGAASPESLGLREKDLVTAVGATRVKSLDDFRQLIVELRDAKNSSITLERQGKPHKILYYLSNS